MFARAQTLEDLDVLILLDWQRAADEQVRMFPPYMRLDDQQPLIVGWPSDAPGLGLGIGSFA